MNPHTPSSLPYQKDMLKPAFTANLTVI